MKKVIPFTKKLTFNTMINEVTDIEVKHTLELNKDKEIEGDIVIDGKYKITENSLLDEEFHYKFPFLIAIDSKYDTSNINISIGDFYYEIINEEELKVNIDIDIDGLTTNEEKEIEEIRTKVNHYEIEELDDPLIELEKEVKEDINEPIIEDNNIESIISNITNTKEEYRTYYVYVVTENDTLEIIMDKYKVSKEELENYNDLSNIKVGTKLIIPYSND